MNIKKLYIICVPVTLVFCAHPFLARSSESLDWNNKDLVIQFHETLANESADVPGIVEPEQVKADMAQHSPDFLLNAMDYYWRIFQRIETQEFHAGNPEWQGRRGSREALNLELNAYVRYGETLFLLERTDPAIPKPSHFKNLNRMADTLAGNVVHEIYKVYSLNLGQVVPFFEELVQFIKNFPSSYSEPQASGDRFELMVPVLNKMLKYEAPEIEAKLKIFSQIRALKKEIE
jgi:hypothetical protein